MLQKIVFKGWILKSLTNSSQIILKQIPDFQKGYRSVNMVTSYLLQNLMHHFTVTLLLVQFICYRGSRHILHTVIISEQDSEI